jgi:hypothetical protein
MTNFPRHSGRDADGLAPTEAGHFMKCPGCRQWFYMQDLGEVMQHIHDAEFAIFEVDKGGCFAAGVSLEG